MEPTRKLHRTVRLAPDIAARLRMEASERELPQSEIIRLALVSKFKTWDAAKRKRKKTATLPD